MRQWTVDAFAAQPYRGNQACVLEPMAAWPDAAWMQTLAAENNQAETAFLLKTADPARFGLRWFTPALEVPLCGHATLASGHVLFSELGVASDQVTFDTKSGPLTVRRAGEGARWTSSQPPTRIDAPAGLAQALGPRRPRSGPGPTSWSCWTTRPRSARARAGPDRAAGDRRRGGAGAGQHRRGGPGAGGADHDVVTRFFAPGSGIPET